MEKEVKVFSKLWGYDWECCMEGGRLIHPDYPYMWYDEECIDHTNNNVYLRIAHKPKEIVHWDNLTYHPVMACGIIRSVETFSYGTFSAEICMPQGKGLWPSFWLCGEGRWPDGGEIDICEGYSDNDYFRLTTPYFPWLNPSWKTTNNIHYIQDGKHMQLGARSISLCKQKHNPSKDFIKYECLWTPDKIVIKADGKVVRKDTDCIKRFKSDRMNVIFNFWCEDPAIHTVGMDTLMRVCNFMYKPLNK